jgi:hypothetical protein
MKKTTAKSKKKPVAVQEFRPYRVLFLVIVISVTCLVMFAALGVGSSL